MLSVAGISLRFKAWKSLVAVKVSLMLMFNLNNVYLIIICNLQLPLLLGIISGFYLVLSCFKLI